MKSRETENSSPADPRPKQIMRHQPVILNGGRANAGTTPALRIAETFTSRQGEGLLTGTPSFFIRTSGCNLRCWFCDTPYASWEPEGSHVAIDELVDTAVASGCRHVVLTGGEPLLPLQSVELVTRLRAMGLHVTIETAGTIARPIAADLMSISPKLLGSGPRGGRTKDTAWLKRHEQTRWRPDVVRELIANAVDYQLKFVVDCEPEFLACVAAVDELTVPADHVWIMPQGTDVRTLDEQASWLRPLVEEHRYRYCDRLHVRWYGNRRGT